MMKAGFSDVKSFDAKEMKKNMLRGKEWDRSGPAQALGKLGPHLRPPI
jgi:hypothetical protein